MKEKKMGKLSDELIEKYLDNRCSEEELNNIKTCISESDEEARKLFRMEEIYYLGKPSAKANDKQTDTAEKALFRRIKQHEELKQKRFTIKRWIQYAAAIVVAGFIGGTAAYWAKHNKTEMNVLVANGGIIEEVLLPDGTKVWLNNSARLKYPTEFCGKERVVHLDGEAYFEVSKDRQKPFIVESEAMRIRVLGTTFNLKSGKRINTAEASLIEGEIEVSGKNEEGQIILAPGQRAELNRNTGRLTVKQVDTRLDAVWHDDLIPFEKANIFTISKALERFYDVKIILSPDIQGDRTYSGVLKKKSTIESVLHSLQNSIPINYKIEGQNIFISSR